MAVSSLSYPKMSAHAEEESVLLWTATIFCTIKLFAEEVKVLPVWTITSRQRFQGSGLQDSTH